MPINKFQDFNKPMMKPHDASTTKSIHVPMSGMSMEKRNLPKMKEMPGGMRKVGRVPEDKSGFKVCKGYMA